MLDRTSFIVKERVAWVKTTDAYDILDPDTRAPLGEAVETAGTFVALLRFVINKNWMPATVEIRSKEDGQVVFRLHRGSFLFRARVDVTDATGQLVGYFRSKFLTLAGGLKVFDQDDHLWAEVKGGRRWFFDYHFKTADGVEVCHVTKKVEGLKGLLKEVFTTSDTFLVAVDPAFADHRPAKMLALGAAIAIDMVFKEGGSGGGSALDLLGG